MYPLKKYNPLQISLLFVVLAFLLPEAAFAQYPWQWNLTSTTTNSQQYNAGVHALAVKAKKTANGKVSVGQTWVNHYGQPDLPFNRLGPADYLNWRGVQSMVISRGYEWIFVGGSSTNYLKDFETDANDNYVILADNKGNAWAPQSHTAGNFKDSTQLLIEKFNHQTNTTVWYHLYGGGSAEYATAIKKTADGNYIVLGQTQSSDLDVTGYHGGKDIWLLKIKDSDGSIIWKKTIGTSADEIPTDLDILPDGSIMVSGGADNSSLFPGNTGLNAFLMKLNSTGDLTWTKTFGGSGADQINAFSIIENNGGFMTISTTTSADGDFTINNGGSDVYICRHDASGAIVWKKQYGFANNDVGGDICYVGCDSLTYASMSRQFTGAPQNYDTWPPFCQTSGIKLALDKNGQQSYYFQDQFNYFNIGGNIYYFNEHLTISIEPNDRGGIITSEAQHALFRTGDAYDGHVTRTFNCYSYGPMLRLANRDTTICKGQPAWGHVFNSDSTYSDSLRNRCNIDTLISTYKVHVINADTTIVKDSTICYGALYKGVPAYSSFIDNSTAQVATICGLRTVIQSTRVTVRAQLPKPFPKDTSACNAAIVLKAYPQATTWLWQDNSGNPTLTAANSGLYWVEIKDINGCIKRDSVNVTRTNLSLTVSPSVTVSFPATAQLSAQSDGTISWTASSSLSCTQCPAPIVSPAATTTYYVTATKAGCKLTGSVEVKVLKDYYLQVPSAFTPNRDTHNDQFKILTNMDTRFVLIIYNRYGQTIYRTNDITKGWNGNYKGIEQPTGNYIYTLSYRWKGVDQFRKGNVLLLR